MVHQIICNWICRECLNLTTFAHQSMDILLGSRIHRHTHTNNNNNLVDFILNWKHWPKSHDIRENVYIWMPNDRKRTTLRTIFFLHAIKMYGKWWNEWDGTVTTFFPITKYPRGSNEQWKDRNKIRKKNLLTFKCNEDESNKKVSELRRTLKCVWNQRLPSLCVHLTLRFKWVGMSDMSNKLTNEK